MNHPTRESIRRRLQRLGGAKQKHRGKFRSLSAEKGEHLAHLVRGWLPDPEDEHDFQNHFLGRLDDDRYTVVPWIDAAMALQGSNVLEIGCGTGASAVSMGEQGAHVVGIDLDDRAVEVARQRCELFGVPAEFHCCNVIDLPDAIIRRSFDIVVFFASLEHMTISERLQAIRLTWDLVRPGGIWCVAEAPNRLWYYDSHTSLMNFYYWLPDEIAVPFARMSNRQFFATEMTTPDADAVKLARFGRGVSFHEFTLSLGEGLNIVSNKDDFLRQHDPAFRLHSLVSKARKYEKFLEKLDPRLNPAFCRQYLNIIIKK